MPAWEVVLTLMLAGNTTLTFKVDQYSKAYIAPRNVTVTIKPLDVAHRVRSASASRDGAWSLSGSIAVRSPNVAPRSLLSTPDQHILTSTKTRDRAHFTHGPFPSSRKVFNSGPDERVIGTNDITTTGPCGVPPTDCFKFSSLLVAEVVTSQVARSHAVLKKYDTIADVDPFLEKLLRLWVVITAPIV